MKIKSIFVAALLLIAFSCHHDDNIVSKETILLTLTVDASYPDIYDDWIIVHAEDGTLLASKSFEPTQELEIVTDKPAQGKIMVTHLQYYRSTGGNKSYSATSHANVEKGRHMFLKSKDVAHELSGKLEVNISNVNFAECPSLSSRFPSAVGAGWSSGTGILNIQTSTFLGLSKYIVSASDGNSLKYKILNDVKANDSYNFSFNDMAQFNQTINFTFPQSNNVNLAVYGGEKDATLIPNAYTLMMCSLYKTRTTVKAGYLDILTNYATVLEVGYTGYAYEYLNRGSIPDGKVAWPQRSDFNITEKSFTNFSATTSKPNVWRLSTWAYNDAGSQTYITWNVSASSGNQLIKELPAEITSIHPALSLDKIKHSSTTFYTESPAFESFVDRDFENAQEPVGLLLGIKITN
jgi:hypothetical protein